MPDDISHATSPVSPVDATLTIRDGPVFHGTAFGANSNISGEAVFTTSLVSCDKPQTTPRSLSRGSSRNSTLMRLHRSDTLNQ